jgi:hypothetical protein
MRVASSQMPWVAGSIAHRRELPAEMVQFLQPAPLQPPALPLKSPWGSMGDDDMAVLGLIDGLDALDRRTRAARVALLTYIALSFADILVAAGEAFGMINVQGGEPTPLNTLGGIVYMLTFVAFLTTAVLVTMWIYRAHANLQAADMPELQYTPGWAVGWYFVPIANLYRPLQAMRELWTQTLGRNDSFSREPDSRLTIWWAAWIVGNILSNASTRLASIDGSAVASLLDVVASGISMVAGWSLLRIIETVNAAQRNGMMMAHVFA